MDSRTGCQIPDQYRSHQTQDYLRLMLVQCAANTAEPAPTNSEYSRSPGWTMLLAIAPNTKAIAAAPAECRIFLRVVPSLV